MNQQKPPKKNKLKNVAMLMGIAFEMGTIIFLAAYGGKWLDDHYETGKRICTAFATLIGVAISIWVVLQRLKRIKY